MHAARIFAGLAIASLAASHAWAQNGVTPNTGHVTLSVSDISVQASALAGNADGAAYSNVILRRGSVSALIGGADDPNGPSDYIEDVKQPVTPPATASVSASWRDGVTPAASAHASYDNVWGAGSMVSQLETPYNSHWHYASNYVGTAVFLDLTPYTSLTISGRVQGMLQAAATPQYELQGQGSIGLTLWNDTHPEDVQTAGFIFGTNYAANAVDDWFSLTLHNDTGDTVRMKWYLDAGTSIGGTWVSSVPEPATYAMGLAGAGVLLLAARRRRR